MKVALSPTDIKGDQRYGAIEFALLPLVHFLTMDFCTGSFVQIPHLRGRTLWRLRRS
jgi:hypothetical protein